MKKLLNLSVQELRLSPGGYLLSRDLSSDYHRRADVSLPGSEWDRVGPSGYDHQASVSCVCIASTACPGRHFVVCSGLCVLSFLLAVFSARLSARRCFQQADIRVARGCLFLSYAFALTQGSSSVLSKACHQGFDRGLSDVSSARLNTLLQLHLRPIDVVVFHAPVGRTHLGRDLALRCFQRLFLPHLATRPCS